MFNLEIKKQISIFMENKPGALNKVASAFADSKINIEGMMVSEAADHAVVRFIVDDPDKAIHVLGEAGMLVIETNVASIEVQDEAGSLGKMAEEFQKYDINLDYAYGTGSYDKKANIIIKVEDMDKLQELFKKNF